MNVRLILPSSWPDLRLAEENLCHFSCESVKQLIGTLDSIEHTMNVGDELLSQFCVNRARALTLELMNPNTKFLWSLRGGYGVQALLPLIPYNELIQSSAKIVVGFSDVTALQAALWKELGWPSLHAPMISSPQWKDSSPDARLLSEIFMMETTEDPRINLESLTLDDANLEIPGILLGGCLSVLTSLIGTPWQLDVSNSILFLEDIGEPPGRILRHVDQWVQSGAIQGVRALVLGSFFRCEDSSRNMLEKHLKVEISKRIKVPTYSSDEIGHSVTNMPIGLGVSASIQNNQLSWSMGELYGCK